MRNAQLQQDLDDEFYGEPIELIGRKTGGDGCASHCRADTAVHHRTCCRGYLASDIRVAVDCLFSSSSSFETKWRRKFQAYYGTLLGPLALACLLIEKNMTRDVIV